MSTQYTELQLTDVVPGPSGSLPGIINTTTSFLSTSRMNSILAAPTSITLENLAVGSMSDIRIDDISNFLHATGDTITLKQSYATSDIHVMSARNLSLYFNTPAKLIQCTEPTQLLLAVRCICDGFFTSLYTKLPLTENATNSKEIAQSTAIDVYQQVPFNDGGSLESHISQIKNYLGNIYVPANVLHLKVWQTNPLLRSAVFAAYYPYFVFIYILSYVPLSGSKKVQRKDIPFLDERQARLCCYLYLMRMVICLHDRIPNDSTCVDACNSIRLFLAQICDNIAFTILEKEQYNVEVSEPVYQETVRTLSSSNKSLSQVLVDENEKYDLYKQNLTSAANSEQSLANKLATTKAWTKFNIWLAIFLSVLFTAYAFVPKDIIKSKVDIKVAYGLCGAVALYVIIVAMIAAVQTL